MTALLILAAVATAGRGDLEAAFGAGAWVPTGSEFETGLSAGPLVEAALLVPMELGGCIWIRSGYRTASSDEEGWDGVSCVPLQIGWRSYPLYRRYAGPRGIEPFAGIGAGGFVAWDDPSSDSVEGSSTGGGMISLELGARIRLGRDTYMDVAFRPEWMPSGRDLAGGEDLSGLSAGVTVAFTP